MLAHRLNYGPKNNPMRQIALTLIVTLMCACAHSQQNSFFDEADTFFKTYVKDGLVNYPALKKESGELEKMVSLIKSEPMMKRADEKAFLINAYNILAIKMVVDNYPMVGPLEVDDFFDKEVFEVHTNRTSLNGLEKKQLYPAFPDPRLHFVLVCAAKGCPKLASHAYRPEGLDIQLDKTTATVINDRSFTRIDESTGQLQLSQIFEWYEKDFGGKLGVMELVLKHYSGNVKDKKTFGHYEYDWSLNSK